MGKDLNTKLSKFRVSKVAILYSNFRGSSRPEQKKCLKYVAGEYHEDFFPLYTRLQLKATENNTFRDKPEHDMNQIM